MVCRKRFQLRFDILVDLGEAHVGDTARGKFDCLAERLAVGSEGLKETELIGKIEYGKEVAGLFIFFDQIEGDLLGEAALLIVHAFEDNGDQPDSPQRFCGLAPTVFNDIGTVIEPQNRLHTIAGICHLDLICGEGLDGLPFLVLDDDVVVEVVRLSPGKGAE